MKEEELFLPEDAAFQDLDIEWMKRVDNWSARKKNKESKKSEIVVDVLSMDVLPGALAMLHIAKRLQMLRRKTRARSTIDAAKFESLRQEQIQLTERLSNYIARFSCHFTIELSPLGPAKYNTSLEGTGKDEDEELINYIGFQYTQELLNLLTTNRLDAIRKCEFCHLWICAIRAKQRFCTMTCRQKFFLSRPDVRAKRKKARQRSYQNLIDRDRKNIEVALNEPKPKRRGR